MQAQRDGQVGHGTDRENGDGHGRVLDGVDHEVGRMAVRDTANARLRDFLRGLHRIDAHRAEIFDGTPLLVFTFGHPARVDQRSLRAKRKRNAGPLHHIQDAEHGFGAGPRPHIAGHDGHADHVGSFGAIQQHHQRRAVVVEIGRIGVEDDSFGFGNSLPAVPRPGSPRRGLGWLEEPSARRPSFLSAGTIP